MTKDNVLEILKKYKLYIPSHVFYELTADIVLFKNECNASAIPIRPKAHWKTDCQGDMLCSKCGHQRPYFIDYTSEGCKVRGKLTPFCPNCGAKMDLD